MMQLTRVSVLRCMFLIVPCTNPHRRAQSRQIYNAPIEIEPIRDELHRDLAIKLELPRFIIVDDLKFVREGYRKGLLKEHKKI